MALALVVATSTGVAVAQDAEKSERPNPLGALFTQLDKNKDGKVTSDEVDENRRRFFDRLIQNGDTDKDGALSREEFTSAAGRGPGARRDGEAGPRGEGGRRPGGPRGEGGPRGGGERGPSLFRMLDTDSDGKLSKDELAKAAEKFDERDANKDGSLDPRELFGFGGGFGGGRGGAPGGRPGGEEFFGRFDTNKDGKISKEEAPERMRENFDRIDANKDGVIEQEELREAFRSMRGRRPGGEGGRGEAGRGEGGRRGERGRDGEGRRGRRPEGRENRRPEGSNE